jgi:hypothetical protein
MGEVIYRPGEERKINTRNQATLHCLQQAYSDPAQVPHRSADNNAGSPSTPLSSDWAWQLLHGCQAVFFSVAPHGPSVLPYPTETNTVYPSTLDSTPNQPLKFQNIKVSEAQRSVG